jgi:hypothetical protein
MVTSTYVTNLGMWLAVQGSSARFLLCSCINWPTGPPSKATTAVYAYITHTMLGPHCTNVPKTCVLQLAEPHSIRYMVMITAANQG